MTKGLVRRVRSKVWSMPVVLLVLPAYLSLLLSSPGRVAGDTKLYLYLNPARLIADSLWTWDSRQLGGWVPHQNVGYLWPTGPWYWIFEAAGVPDWIAQRMWLGTIVAVAGMGCFWFGRRLGLSVPAAVAAAMVYEYSPFVLPYISRTSALLLPWALLPWMCAVSMIAGRRWLAVAAFGFLVLSSGGLNATALLMIAPGPAIWIVHQWRSGQLSGFRALRTIVLLGCTSLLVSAWWLAGLFVQGRFGAAVLSYSESLVSTAATSSTPEVLRGLGYWLFYDRNDVVALTSASTPYQGSLVVLAAGGALILLGLRGILGDRTWRWPLMSMTLVGVVLAVGPHPFDDPSPIWSLAVDHPKSAASLALRSSTRAVPLVVLALALGVGSLIERRRARRPSPLRAHLVPLWLVVLVAVNAPAVISGELIDPDLTRPETLPRAWSDAAKFLDERFDEGYSGSVLLVPGMESAAYRWGYPVDPILPGLTKKPFISRDWLPLGSAPMMDLLYALDDSFQSGTGDGAAVAPIARMLGADTVMVVTSPQYERFGTVRPEKARALLGDDPPGLELLETFGPPARNRAVENGLERWSEDLVAHPPMAQPEILLYAVDDPASPARASDRPVLVAADGSGLVDLGALGILDGTELVLAEAALDEQQVRDAVSAAAEVIVTDSNRRRAHHWRSSQDVTGATEPLAGVVLASDLFDSRLPVFPDATDASRTIVAPGSVRAVASSYGPLLSYWPEYRPSMAVDGDLGTAWRVGVDADPVGQTLRIESDGEPIDRLRLVQPLGNEKRWITGIDYRLADGPWTALSLESSSRTATGQVLELPTPSMTITVRISAIDAEIPGTGNTSQGVGFAEVLGPERTSPEMISVPRRLEQLVTPSTPVSFAFTRLRADPTDRWRQDPEQSLLRTFATASTDSYDLGVSVRLSPRLDDVGIVTTLGLSAVDEAWSSIDSLERLQGSARWWSASAIDGNPDSAWWSAPFVDPNNPGPTGLSIPLRTSVSELTLRQVDSSRASTVTEIRLEALTASRIAGNVTVDVPTPDADGNSLIRFPALSGERLNIVITGIDPLLVRDGRSDRVLAAPVGIAEISSPGAALTGITSLARPSRLATDCRSDLLSIDGEPISLRIEGSMSDALAGEPLPVTPCDSSPITISSGVHELRSSTGRETGWQVDAVVLRSTNRRESAPADPVRMTRGRDRRTLLVPPCPRRCWIELPDGWNNGWRTDDRSQSVPLASAAGRNLLVREAAGDQDLLTLRWTPQRYMWWGLLLTGVTAVFLVTVALLDVLGRLRRRQFSPESAVPKRPSSFTVPIAALALGALAINLAWGVVLAFVAAATSRRPRILAGIGWSLVALSMAFLVAQQIRTGAVPGFSWPTIFARAHRPALAGVVLSWCASLALDRRRSAAR